MFYNKKFFKEWNANENINKKPIVINILIY